MRQTAGVKTKKTGTEPTVTHQQKPLSNRTWPVDCKVTFFYAFECKQNWFDRYHVPVWRGLGACIWLVAITSRKGLGYCCTADGSGLVLETILGSFYDVYVWASSSYSMFEWSCAYFSTSCSCQSKQFSILYHMHMTLFAHTLHVPVMCLCALLQAIWIIIYTIKSTLIYKGGGVAYPGHISSKVCVLINSHIICSW